MDEERNPQQDEDVEGLRARRGEDEEVEAHRHFRNPEGEEDEEVEAHRHFRNPEGGEESSKDDDDDVEAHHWKRA